MSEQSTRKSVLIIDEDVTLQQMLADNFNREGFSITTAVDGEVGLKLAHLQKPDLVVLDIVLPKLDGLSVCRRLHHQMNVPIIILSARASEVDKIVGLDAGADDYITKPFSWGELAARVRAVLRRSQKPKINEMLVSNDLALDFVGRKAYKGQRELTLANKEFDLLATLMRNPGAILTYDFLLTMVWGSNHLIPENSRTVAVHIRWLREKIEKDPSNPRRIVNVRSLGYRFEG